MKIIPKLYQRQIINHYKTFFKTMPKVLLWEKQPAEKLLSDFRVLEFPPNQEKGLWVYATCCMSQPVDTSKIEVHIYSSVKDESIVELLTSLAYYHRVTNSVGLNHTINFGRPWQRGSKCNYGFISLPYLDGPELEDLSTKHGLTKIYLLIPISEPELRYATTYGVEALESKFDNTDFAFYDPFRPNVV